MKVYALKTHLYHYVHKIFQKKEDAIAAQKKAGKYFGYGDPYWRYDVTEYDLV